MGLAKLHWHLKNNTTFHIYLHHVYITKFWIEVQDLNSDFELLGNDVAKRILIGTVLNNVGWQFQLFCLRNTAGFEKWQI